MTATIKPLAIEPTRSPASAAVPSRSPQMNRCKDCHESRDHHLPECGIGGDRDAGFIVRLCLAFHESGDLLKLPAHLLHDVPSCLADSRHGKGTEEEGEHRTDQDPDKDYRG